MRVDPLRIKAWEILVAVQGGADLDPLLDEAQVLLDEARDRSFLAILVRGTLQWQGRYDQVIKSFSSRKFPSDPGLLCLLRLGLHQLLALDSVPPFAAIDQTVGLCKRCLDARKSGFVNGLLRNVQRRLGTAGPPTDPAVPAGGLAEVFRPLQDDDGAFLAAWYSHPRWLVERWLEVYGIQKTEALCAFNNQEVPLDLHALGPEIPGKLVEELGSGDGMVAPLNVPGGLRMKGHLQRRAIVDLLARYPELIVQDATVQEATGWLGQGLAMAPAGLPVMDMCAAPGGKTVHLSAMGHGQWPMVAMDADERRMQQLSATIKRTRALDVSMLCGDGLQPPCAAGCFGGVLLDGPCSGTGVLRRHPDARWRSRPGVVKNKARLLKKLAERAFELLAPGGVLMYATCSLQPEENQEVVEGLLAHHQDLATLPDEQGRWLRTWLPPEAPGDGFFAARLRRIK